MSRYAVDKALWEITRKPGVQAAFEQDFEAFAAGRDLSPDERAALHARDIRAVFAGGAHPFLVYAFAIRMAGGWSFPFMKDYVERLAGLELVDIET